MAVKLEPMNPHEKYFKPDGTPTIRGMEYFQRIVSAINALQGT